MRPVITHDHQGTPARADVSILCRPLYSSSIISILSDLFALGHWFATPWVGLMFNSDEETTRR